MIFSTEKNERPLSHLTVLDLANETGAFCSRILASAGATVIKIEKPAGNKPVKPESTKQDKKDPITNIPFLFNNTGKLSITLNLDKRKGRELFLRLVSQADILIETQPPQYLARRKMDYSRLSQINDRLIMASITSFGNTGPGSRYPASDIIASAGSGQLYLNGKKGGLPSRLYGEQSYFLSSLFAATGILIALQERWISNKGQYIDISLQETMTSPLTMIMSRYFQDNTVTGRNGNLHWGLTAGIFPCRDGFIFITFDREWDTLIDWMSAENMAVDLADKDWQVARYRRQNISHIVEIISKWTKTHGTQELFQTAQLMRLPWAPVQTVDQVMTNPQLQSRNFFARLTQDLKAPTAGEHNRLIFQERFGFSRKQLSQWEKSGII
jgi:benzylsuccinate CoA-transferase BbsE subunit